MAAAGEGPGSPKNASDPPSSQDSHGTTDQCESSSTSDSSSGHHEGYESPVIEDLGRVKAICEPAEHQAGHQNATVIEEQHHHYHKDKFSFVSFKTADQIEHHAHHHHNHITHVHNHHHYHFAGSGLEKVAMTTMALGCRFLREREGQMGVPVEVEDVPEGGWGSHPGAQEQSGDKETVIESDMDSQGNQEGTGSDSSTTSARPEKIRRKGARYF